MFNLVTMALVASSQQSSPSHPDWNWADEIIANDDKSSGFFFCETEYDEEAEEYLYFDDNGNILAVDVDGNVLD